MITGFTQTAFLPGISYIVSSIERKYTNTSPVTLYLYVWQNTSTNPVNDTTQICNYSVGSGSVDPDMDSVIYAEEL
jgi:hypothetical protein